MVTFFRVGINRWNGNVVMAYQDHPEARFYIRLIIAQLSSYVDMFDADNYAEPRHGLIRRDDFSDFDCEPVYLAAIEEVAYMNDCRTYKERGSGWFAKVRTYFSGETEVIIFDSYLQIFGSRCFMDFGAACNFITFDMPGDWEVASCE